MQEKLPFLSENLHTVGGTQPAVSGVGKQWGGVETVVSWRGHSKSKGVAVASPRRVLPCGNVSPEFRDHLIFPEKPKIDFFFFLKSQNLVLSLRLESSGAILALCSLEPLASSHPPALATKSAGIVGEPLCLAGNVVNYNMVTGAQLCEYPKCH